MPPADKREREREQNSDFRFCRSFSIGKHRNCRSNLRMLVLAQSVQQRSRTREIFYSNPWRQSLKSGWVTKAAGFRKCSQRFRQLTKSFQHRRILGLEGIVTGTVGIWERDRRRHEQLELAYGLCIPLLIGKQSTIMPPRACMGGCNRESCLKLTLGAWRHGANSCHVVARHVAACPT